MGCTGSKEDPKPQTKSRPQQKPVTSTSPPPPQPNSTPLKPAGTAAAAGANTNNAKPQEDAPKVVLDSAKPVAKTASGANGATPGAAGLAVTRSPRDRGSSFRRGRGSSQIVREPEQFKKSEKFAKLRPVPEVVSQHNAQDLEEQLRLLEKEKQLQQERITALVQEIKVKQQERADAGSKKTGTLKKTRMTREERARIQEIFNRFDADGSNEIDSIEFRGMCKELGVELTAAEAQEHILNISQTGAVDFDTFLTWWVGESAGKGGKNIAVSVAKSRLKSMAAAGKGMAEQIALESARAKAGVGVAIDTDIKATIGDIEVPRTQIKASLSNCSADLFKEVKETRFADCNVPDEDPGTFYMIAEFEVADEPRGEVDAFVGALRRMCAAIEEYVCKSDTEGRWLRVRIEDKRPCLTLRIAASDTDMERRWLATLLGSENPDAEDLDRLISKLELDINLGANLKEQLRQHLVDAESFMSLGNDGVSMALKGSIAPGVVALLQRFIADGSGDDDLLTSKIRQFIAASIHYAQCDLSMGYPLTELDAAISTVVDNIAASIPETEHTPELVEELNDFKIATLFTTTLVLEKTLTLSNTPLDGIIKKIRRLPEEGFDQKFGWNSAEYEPAQLIYSAARHIQEVRNLSVYTKYQSLVLDMSGVAMGSALPRSDEEFRKFLNQRRVSRRLHADYSQAQLLEFPLLLKAIQDFDDEENDDAFERIASVIDAIEQVRDEDLEFECPG